MPRVTRRRFFEESMIATAVAAAAPRILVADDTAGSAANSTIRHAVIGCRIRGKEDADEFDGQDGTEVLYFFYTHQTFYK